MNSFKRTNLQNIKNRFETQTGVDLSTPSGRVNAKRVTSIAIIAVFMFSISMTAFASSAFSDLDGDDLSLGSVYEGDGIVTIFVENRSDKNLSFDEQLKLMLWSTGEEVETLPDGEVIFDSTDFAAHSSGSMTVDLTNAYDISTLEQPLTDDHYYFILTNNNFIFGQDWMCSVFFSEPIITPAAEPEPLPPVSAGGQVFDELLPYFGEYVSDPAERNRRASEYFAKCCELLSGIDANIVPTCSPMLVIDGLDPDVVFDDTAPLDKQHWLTGLHHRVLDGYNIPVGASDFDSALVLSAYAPQRKGGTDGGADIPLLYFFIYAKADITSQSDLAFVRGQLLTFEQMEKNKVYEDDSYVCYDMTDLFYSDLREYVESIVSQRTDIYYDEQVFARIQNIYNYYRDKEVLSERFYYNLPSE